MIVVDRIDRRGVELSMIGSVDMVKCHGIAFSVAQLTL